MRKINYNLGCLKDPKDLRDIPMGLVLPPIPIPAKADYTKAMTPVRDQGDEGTCVAFASVVGVKEYEDKKEYKKPITLSPRYIYNLCKQNDGAPEEEGTYPRIAMKMLLKRGVCRESFWPYKPHQSDRPKTGASKDAKRYKIIAYARLHTVLEMKRSLVVNGPFLAGVDVYESWFTDTASRTGMIPMPKRGDQYQGGHAICIVGYDDSKKLFRFKNSWGTTWGSKGYGYLSYDYLKSYCMDAWSATDLIEDPKLIVAKREVLLEQYV